MFINEFLFLMNRYRPRPLFFTLFLWGLILNNLGGIDKAMAQTLHAYPTKALRFILPFPPGGATDALGRTVAELLQLGLKQNIIPDYKPGAGGNVGYALLSRAPADGYTIGLCSPSITISPGLYKNPGYDLKDLGAISLVANIPSLLVVHPSVPANNLRELIAMAKKNPGQLNFGSGGVGTSNHLAGEMLKYLAKINITHIPYKGTSIAMFSLITGETDMVTIGPPAALGLLREKKLKALAILRKERIPQLPNVLTSAESGLPGWELNTWYGLIAPSGVSPDIMSRLNFEMNKGLQAPETQRRLQNVGAEPMASTIQEFSDFIKSQTQLMTELIHHAGIKAD